MLQPKKNSAAGRASFTSFVFGIAWVLLSLLIIFGGNMLLGYEVILLGKDTAQIGDGIKHVAELTGIPAKALWINAFCAIVLDILMYRSSLKNKK